MARSKRRRRLQPSPHPTTPIAPTGAGAPASLADLRRSAQLTQVGLAEQMGVSQRAVSHVEYEPNPRLRTLEDYVRGLGGRLQMRAIFADRVVELSLPKTRPTGAGPNEPLAPPDSLGSR